MHFRKPKIKLIVLLTIIITTAFKTHSQTNSEITLYTKFDSIVGQENSGLNNGPLALNPYKTIGDNTIFKGNVLALTSITMNSNATAEGRMLARNGSVVMTSTNIITKP